jgi:hypothetical protein
MAEVAMASSAFKPGRNFGGETGTCRDPGDFYFVSRGLLITSRVKTSGVSPLSEGGGRAFTDFFFFWELYCIPSHCVVRK